MIEPTKECIEFDTVRGLINKVKAQTTQEDAERYHKTTGHTVELYTNYADALCTESCAGCEKANHFECMSQ